MIIEFLDAKKKRIASATTESLVTGEVGRATKNNRFIGDTVELEFTLELLDIIKKSKYILLSDNGLYRVNPLLKITEIDYSDTVRVLGKSSELEQAEEIKLSWEGIIEGNTERETVIEEVGYDTVYIEDENLLEGETYTLEQGQNGIIEKVYDVTYENGKEVSRILVGESYIQEPVDEVIVYGTKEEDYREEYITEIEEIPFDFEIRENEELPVWEENIIQEGEDGEVLITYIVDYVDGIEVSRTEIEKKVIKEPRNIIVEYGTHPDSRIEYFVAEEHGIPYETEEKEVEGIPEGFMYKIQEGIEGKQIRFYDIYYMGDIEVGRVESEGIQDYYYPAINEVYVKGNTTYGENVEVRVEDIPIKEERYPHEYIIIGEEEIMEEGEEGYLGVVYKELTDGEGNKIGEEVVAEVILKEMKPTIVMYGTMETRERREYGQEIEEYEIKYIEDPYLPLGEQVVTKEGVNGEKKVSWEITEEYIDGTWVEVDRIKEFENYNEKKRDEEVYVGTGELVNEAITLNLTHEEPIEIEKTSYLTGRVRRLNENTTTGLYSFINKELSKIGYELEIIADKTEEEVTREVVKYLETEFTVMELIEALLQVIEGTAEFDTVIEGDYVVNTKIRVGDKLGKDFTGELRYEENITSFKIDERREGIITAVEYTGMELSQDTGKVLTLNWEGKGVGRDYVLPKSKRPVRLEVYSKRDGTKQYVLEDKESTSIYGNETSILGREVDPKIKTVRNGNITRIEDLIEESIKELDGKSIPRTRYNITAVVKGLDVGDYVNVKLPHLKVDMSMPVLSVNYEIGNPEVVYITVGEYLPTEMERIFEELPKTGGDGGGNFYDSNGNVYEPGYYDEYGNWNNGGYWDDDGNFNTGFFDEYGNWLEDGGTRFIYVQQPGYGWFDGEFPSTQGEVDWDEWSTIFNAKDKEESVHLKDNTSEYVNSQGSVEIEAIGTVGHESSLRVSKESSETETVSATTPYYNVVGTGKWLTVMNEGAGIDGLIGIRLGAESLDITFNHAVNYRPQGESSNRYNHRITGRNVLVRIGMNNSDTTTVSELRENLQEALDSVGSNSMLQGEQYIEGGSYFPDPENPTKNNEPTEPETEEGEFGDGFGGGGGGGSR